VQDKNQNHPNLTPNDLKPQQDMLLLAGSKVSFAEIYHQEIDLPMYKNKYYKAEDVDNLFVLMNGIFTQVSEQAFRNDKALSEARESFSNSQAEVKKASDTIAQLKEQLAAVQAANNDMQTQLAEAVNKQVAMAQQSPPQQDMINQDLAKQLADKTDDYQRLLTSSSAKMNEQNATINELRQTNDNLNTQVQKLSSEVEKMKAEAANQKDASETGLQSKYDMLSYKYENLKKLSAQRIQALQESNFFFG
jgi:chromosome segregation ATPase